MGAPVIPEKIRWAIRDLQLTERERPRGVLRGDAWGDIQSARATLESAIAEVIAERDALQKKLNAETSEHKGARAKITRLEQELEDARAGCRKRAEERDKAIAERDALRAFAQDIMQAWPHGGVDGGEIQDAADLHGLLQLTDPPPAGPCGDNCQCAEVYDGREFASGQVECYRRTPLLTGEQPEGEKP